MKTFNKSDKDKTRALTKAQTLKDTGQSTAKELSRDGKVQAKITT